MQQLYDFCLVMWSGNGNLGSQDTLRTRDSAFQTSCTAFGSAPFKEMLQSMLISSQKMPPSPPLPASIPASPSTPSLHSICIQGDSKFFSHSDLFHRMINMSKHTQKTHTILNAWNLWAHLILCGENYYYFHITEEETEAQRSKCATMSHSAREKCSQYFNLGNLCSELTLQHYSFNLETSDTRVSRKYTGYPVDISYQIKQPAFVSINMSRILPETSLYLKFIF